MIFKGCILSYVALSGHGRYDFEKYLFFKPKKKQEVRAPEPPPLKQKYTRMQISGGRLVRHSGRLPPSTATREPLVEPATPGTGPEGLGDIPEALG